jgi:hypothetical protein
MTREEQLEAALQRACNWLESYIHTTHEGAPEYDDEMASVEKLRSVLAAPATAEGDDFMRGWEAGRDAARDVAVAQFQAAAEMRNAARNSGDKYGAALHTEAAVTAGMIRDDIAAITPPAPGDANGGQL